MHKGGRGGGRGGRGGGPGGGDRKPFARQWATEVPTFPDRDIPLQKPLTTEDEFKLGKANLYHSFFRSSVFFQLPSAAQPRDVSRYTDRYVVQRDDICKVLQPLLRHPKRCYPSELLSAKLPTRKRRGDAKARGKAVAPEDALKTLEGKEEKSGALADDDEAKGADGPTDGSVSKKARRQDDGEGGTEGAGEGGDGGEEDGEGGPPGEGDDEEDAGDYGDAYMDGGVERDDGADSGDDGGGDEATF